MAEICPFCQKSFSRKYNRDRHIKEVHADESQPINRCLLCGQSFNLLSELQEHHDQEHKPDEDFKVRESAFRGSAVSYRYHYKHRVTKLEHIYTPEIQEKVFNTLMYQMVSKKILRFSVVHIAEMVQRDSENQVISSIDVPFRSYASFGKSYSEVL